MCGIAGFSLSPTHNPDVHRLARNLLLEIEARGHHATGMGWSTPDGETFYTKDATPAHEFVEYALDLLDVDARTVILHTRYATQGSPRIETNNHPIIRPGILGVHNGHISNDDEVFEMLNTVRYGQVDSEAAFALIDESGLHPTEAITLLEGRVALAWMTTDAPDTLHVARYKDSPIAVAQTKAGSFVFASTMPMLDRAARASGLGIAMRQNVPEGWYLRVRSGRICDTLSIGFTTPAELLTV